MLLWNEENMRIYNVKIHTQTEQGILETGYVDVEQGKITAVCAGNPDFVKESDIDGKGRNLYPGFIDAHTHLGIIENGIDFEGDDCNEATDPFMPHLRAIDGIQPMDYCFEEALAAGITTVASAPGSANPCGGEIAILKTSGRIIDKMVFGSAMKFALGENPKNVYHDRDETPVTRMGTAALIREGLMKAKRYQQDLEEGNAPEYDAKCEALLPLLKRQIRAHFHCHRADDICTAIRLAEEFSLDYVIIHGTQAHKIADYLAEKQVPVIAGPILCDRCKPEMADLTIENPRILQENGVAIALCTDHPVIPIQYLPMTAALAVKGGMKQEDAIYAITRGAAELLGVEQEVGSIQVGLDADLQLYAGNPLDIQEKPCWVMVNGKMI